METKEDESGGLYMERWRCIHAFFYIQCIISIGFSFVLHFEGLYWVACIELVLPLFEDQPFLFVWSMIRRTGHEFLLQLERSACIAITILVRLQQVNRTLID
jgi:hypothetical protein